MAVVMRWTDATTEVLLQCQRCGASYSMQVSASTGGHGRLATQIATIKLQREVGRQSVQSPAACPRCGHYDEAEARARGRRLQRGLTAQLVVGSAFGAFFPAVWALQLAIDPKVGASTAPIWGMAVAWLLAVAAAFYIRYRRLPSPWNLNTPSLADQRRDAQWKGDGTPHVTAPQNVGLLGWTTLLGLSMFLGIPLAMALGGTVASGEWGATAGLAVVVSVLFGSALLSARKAAGLVRATEPPVGSSREVGGT